MAPDFVRAASNHTEPRIVIIRSSHNPLYDAPIKWFIDASVGEVTVFTLKASDDETLTRSVRQISPRLVFTLGSKATTFARSNLPDIPDVFAMVVDYRRLKMGRDIAGIAIEPTYTDEFSQFKMILPGMKRVLAFHSPDYRQLVREAREDLNKLGIELQSIEIQTPDDVANAFPKNLTGVDALWLMRDPALIKESVFKFLRERSHQSHVPLLASLSEEFAQAGAMAAVSVDFTSLGAQAAAIAREILAGKAPNRVGVQAPIGVYLALNLDVADQINVSVPLAVMGNVNRVFSTAAKLAAAQPRTASSQPSVRLVVFFDPDANHDALLQIASWFTRFLQTIDPDLKLQPVRSIGAFEELQQRGQVSFAILPSSYVRAHLQDGTIVPLLVPSANGSVDYRKVMFARSQDAKPKTLAVTVSGAATQEELAETLLSSGISVDRSTIIPVSKDLDALLALMSGQVDAAVVKLENLEVVKTIKPDAAASLKRLQETRPITRTPFVALSNVHSTYQAMVIAAIKTMMSDPSGALAMRALGLDAWISFDPSMLH